MTTLQLNWRRKNKEISFYSFFCLIFSRSNSSGQSSNDETSKEMDNTPLEQQIEQVMKDNKLGFQTILDSDIKDNFIFVVVENANKHVNVAIIKNNNGKLEWVAGDDGATILQGKGSTFVSIFKSTDVDMENVKEVKVFGEPAKLVSIFIDGTYLREIKYWIA